PPEFTRSWQAGLESAERSLANPSRSAEIRKAYLGELPVAVGPSAPPVFPGWQHSVQAATFSSLLKAIGDAYAASGERSRAIERYAQAFVLDPANTEAPLYLVNLLAEYPQELDPQGHLFDQLLAALPPRQAVTEAKDGSDLLRLHFLLGTVLERRARWGSEE